MNILSAYELSYLRWYKLDFFSVESQISLAMNYVMFLIYMRSWLSRKIPKLLNFYTLNFGLYSGTTVVNKQ